MLTSIEVTNRLIDTLQVTKLFNNEDGIRWQNISIINERNSFLSESKSDKGKTVSDLELFSIGYGLISRLNLNRKIKSSIDDANRGEHFAKGPIERFLY